MLLVDSTLVLQIVAARRSAADDTDGQVVDAAVSLISDLTCWDDQSDEEDVRIAVEGVCSADVLERRRRASYARASATHSPVWDVDKSLPGTPFHDCLVRELRQGKGGGTTRWTVSGAGGSVLTTLSRFFPLPSSSLSASSPTRPLVSLFARERDSDALAAVHGLELVATHGWLRTYSVRTHMDTNADADALVLDILTGITPERGSGVLVQDLPGLPLCSATHLRRAYREWGGGTLTSWWSPTSLRLNRSALIAMLARYAETYEDGAAVVGWRERHLASNFPHGSDLACGQYLDAVERELRHLSPAEQQQQTETETEDVYVHACAPSALDLVNSCALEGVVLSPPVPPTVPTVPVSRWSPDMQLAAILPRSAPSGDPRLSPLHTRLDMGCVHMFPTSYSVLRGGTYPVIPTLDLARFERAYHLVR